jgi:hypothetical protein
LYAFGQVARQIKQLTVHLSHLFAVIISTAIIFYFCVNAVLHPSRYGDRQPNTISSPSSARIALGQFRVDLSCDNANTHRAVDIEYDFAVDKDEKEKGLGK